MMTTKSKNKEESYKTIRAELDDVLVRLQDPASDVDDAVALYEQATRLTAKLETYLETAENHIKKVQADFSTSTLDEADELTELED